MRRLLLIMLIAVSGFACKKSEEKRCQGLETAIKTDDAERVKNIVTLLAFDLEPKVTTEDPSGNSNNFRKLIDRLNGECGVAASEMCYGCIYTFPATSEIKVEIALGTNTVTRFLDIRPNQLGKLICSAMHE